MTPRSERSTAEWVSLVGSAAVLAVVIGLIALQIPGNSDPAAPAARIVRVRVVDDSFHVDVAVDNDGDVAAANVQVMAELTIGPDGYSGDQTVDFLSGGEEADMTFVFDHDPASGELSVRVTGFAVP